VPAGRRWWPFGRRLTSDRQPADHQPADRQPADHQPDGRWRWGRLRQWRRWTLRSRLVLAIATLAAVGLVISGAVGVAALRSYLFGQVDSQLDSARRFADARPAPFDQSELSRAGDRPSFGPDNGTYRFDADGVLLRKDNAAGPDLGSPAQVTAHATGRPFTVHASNGDWRVIVVQRSDHSGYFASAVSLRSVDGIVNSLIVTDVSVSLAVLILLGVGAASVVRIGLLPLTRMEEAAADIADGDLTRRVEDADPHTESGRLGVALNSMLSRIEDEVAARTNSEQRLRRFLADASHELRTPLTSIQGFAELYRRGGAPPGPQLDEAMGRIESEVGRMRLLVNDLLLLAKLDEERPLEQHPVDLLSVAADSVRDAHVRVPTRFVALGALDDSRDTFEPVTVLGDEARIRQVATNLVANALQHTPEDAKIMVRVGRPDPGLAPTGEPAAVVGAEELDGPVAVIEVGDTGPGMSREDAVRAFERLYRADRSRSRSHGGAGLGLAIVAAIVTGHGGRVELWTAPGDGCRFRVLLPAEPPLPDDLELD
jgi:two-component system, OmpR family, sensor kinase